MSSESENKIIGSDLLKMAELLPHYNLLEDTSALQTAGQNCMYASTDQMWKYTMNKISFSIDEIGGSIPMSSEDLMVTLSVGIEGITVPAAKITNPLIKLNFDIEIEGYHSETIEPLYASWHLDLHEFKQGDGKPKYSHPLYHFTFGGHKMEAKGDVFGGVLVLPTPRIAYPPMDAVLGIDFILQNYIHKDKIDEIIRDPEYIAIMQRAQERLWKPYFSALMAQWDGNIQPVADFSCQMLFPLYH